ncbi:hypothetical protein F7725_024778 [Dissostichus mawsoni]|uniref:TTF-type domain-containing protein n=1 Tax=Dissostichus mawsoni TaxID=36200 RepID=A0A7J5X989_DISMA|nr:hypothetical protein F7725_024778 [Dissostichus mawsoni]
MPKKERIQKRKEKERQETAKSTSLNAWLKPSTSSNTQERTDNSNVESVTPEKAVEISQATLERQGEALEAHLTQSRKMIRKSLSVWKRKRPQEGKRGHIKIASLKYPTDPANQAFDLKCNVSYVKMCVVRGPCQPILRFPKNTEGRSFQKMWYENKPWLEYSPEKDSMYCFSCRLFLNEQKYSNKSAWRVAGVNNWKRGLDKCKNMQTQRPI